MTTDRWSENLLKIRFERFTILKAPGFARGANLGFYGLITKKGVGF